MRRLAHLALLMPLVALPALAAEQQPTFTFTGTFAQVGEAGVLSGAVFSGDATLSAEAIKTRTIIAEAYEPFVVYKPVAVRVGVGQAEARFPDGSLTITKMQGHDRFVVAAGGLAELGDATLTSFELVAEGPAGVLALDTLPGGDALTALNGAALNIVSGVVGSPRKFALTGAVEALDRPGQRKDSTPTTGLDVPLWAVALAGLGLLVALVAVFRPNRTRSTQRHDMRVLTLLLVAAALTSTGVHALPICGAGQEGMLAYDNPEKVLKLCDGATWKPIGGILISPTGAEVCNASFEGSVRYVVSTDKLELCNGTAWAPVTTDSAQWVTIGDGRIYYNGGYVGIGVTSPTVSLDVSGTTQADKIKLRTTAGGTGVDPVLYESDPQVGTIQANKWCSGDGVGGAIVCTNDTPVGAEADPQVNTLTNGKWCATDGTAVNCDKEPPVGTLTNGKWCVTDGTTVNCTQDAPAQWTEVGDGRIYYNGGNVGIGVASPTTPLDVLGTTYTGRLKLRTEATGAALDPVLYETDPQVDALTAGKWCKADGAGNAIDCTEDAPVAAESDPQVGTLTNTKWCTTDGTTVECTTDAPVTTEADPQVGTLTNTKWCATDGTAVNCDQDAPVSSKWAAGTDDNINRMTGNVGIGVSDAVVPLQVAGSIMVGANASACTSTLKGAMRFNTTSNKMEFCDGSTWATLVGGGTGAPQPQCGGTNTYSTQMQTSLVISAGCTVQFKVWGAGGGSGNPITGGGGGYATITLGPLGADTTYYLVVGGGGGTSAVRTGGAGLTDYTGGSGAFGGSGSGCGGGAASGIWTVAYGDTPVLVAGGGGGCGATSAGAAGGVGTQAAGTAGTNGVASGNLGGGGGGGGYATGGAGGTQGGGGGGSSYAAPGGSTAAGSGSTPGNVGDPNRPGVAGYAGALGYGGANGAIWYTSW